LYLQHEPVIFVMVFCVRDCSGILFSMVAAFSEDSVL